MALTEHRHRMISMSRRSDNGIRHVSRREPSEALVCQGSGAGLAARLQAQLVVTDILAGVTLAAVAIPETMGYTSIAQTPVVTGLYTVIFPTLVFALLGSSRLLVVGADSATAAILAAGLAGRGIAGLTPNSPEWLACTSSSRWSAAACCSSPGCSSSGSSATSCPHPCWSASSPASASRCSPVRSPTCSASPRARATGSSSSGGP